VGGRLKPRSETSAPGACGHPGGISSKRGCLWTAGVIAYWASRGSRQRGDVGRSPVPHGTRCGRERSACAARNDKEGDLSCSDGTLPPGNRAVLIGDSNRLTDSESSVFAPIRTTVRSTPRFALPASSDQSMHSAACVTAMKVADLGMARSGSCRNRGMQKNAQTVSRRPCGWSDALSTPTLDSFFYDWATLPPHSAEQKMNGGSRHFIGGANRVQKEE
jgi:hypothetical protein